MSTRKKAITRRRTRLSRWRRCTRRNIIIQLQLQLRLFITTKSQPTLQLRKRRVSSRRSRKSYLATRRLRRFQLVLLRTNSSDDKHAAEPPVAASYEAGEE